MSEEDKIDDSPAFRFSCILEDLHALSKEERYLLDRVKIGISKLIMSHYNLPFRIQARESCKIDQKKLLGLTAAEKLILQDASPKIFRPWDIRNQLPEEMKYIDSSQITDISKYFLNTGIFERSSIPKGKPGRKPPRPRGVRSYYKQTEYHRKVLKLLSKPLVLSLLYSFLLESHLLHRYLYSSNLLMLQMVKRRRAAFQEINMATFGESTDGIANDLYEGIKNFDDNQLEKLVKKTLDIILQKTRIDSPLLRKLYIWGAIYYSSK